MNFNFTYHKHKGKDLFVFKIKTNNLTYQLPKMNLAYFVHFIYIYKILNLFSFSCPTSDNTITYLNVINKENIFHAKDMKVKIFELKNQDSRNIEIVIDPHHPTLTLTLDNKKIKEKFSQAIVNFSYYLYNECKLKYIRNISGVLNYLSRPRNIEKTPLYKYIESIGYYVYGCEKFNIDMTKIFNEDLYKIIKNEYTKSLSYLIVVKIKRNKKLKDLFDINIFKHILVKYLY